MTGHSYTSYLSRTCVEGVYRGPDIDISIIVLKLCHNQVHGLIYLDGCHAAGAKCFHSCDPAETETELKLVHSEIWRRKRHACLYHSNYNGIVQIKYTVLWSHLLKLWQSIQFSVVSRLVRTAPFRINASYKQLMHRARSYGILTLYFVSSRERPWRHWSRPRIHLQDASFMHQSRCSFLNVWENTQVACVVTSVFLRNTRWRHGRSWGETKYSCNLILIKQCDCLTL